MFISIPTQFVFADTNQIVEDALNGISTQNSNEINKQFLSSRNEVEELIDPQTGSLTYKQTDLLLPGKDGLDLSLTRMYHSSSAEIGTKKVAVSEYVSDYVCDSKPVYIIIVYALDESNGYSYVTYETYSEALQGIDFYNSFPETRAVYYQTDETATNCRYVYNVSANNYVDKNTYERKRYDLGIGWSFAFPSVEEESGYLYFHDGTGASYQIDLNQGNSNLINYQGKDVKFLRDNATYTNGQSSSYYVFQSSDQRKTYFSQDGRILGVKDRFNNEIKFTYVNRTVGGNSNQYISKIIDSIGRSVDFVYENSIESQTFDGEDISVTITDPTNSNNKTSIVYTKYRDLISGNYQPKLWKVTRAAGKPEAQTYTYDYDTVQSGFRFDAKSTSTSDSFIYISLLKKVRGPNLSTYFNYEGVDRNLGNDGLYKAYHVTSRYDKDLRIINGALTETGEKNKITYTYQNDPSGYPTTNNENLLPENFEYGSEATSSTGVKVKSVFNNKRKQIRYEEIAPNGEKKVYTNLLFDNVFTFKPARTETKEFVGSTLVRTLYVDRQYTDWGGIKSETHPLTINQLNDPYQKDRYTIKYEYEPNFKFLTKRTWYQNSSNLLSEEYSYDTLGRIISFKNPKEEITNYTYLKSSEEEKIEISQSSANGKVARTTQIFGKEAKFAFKTQENQGYTDTNNQYVESSNRYEYDLLFGLMKKDTNQENKTIGYNYDQLGRIVSIKTPGYTNQSGEIFDTEYLIEYIPNVTPSELNTQNANLNTTLVKSKINIKNITSEDTSTFEEINQYYDGFGNLISKHVKDTGENEWFEESENQFDNQNRIIFSTNSNQDSSSIAYDYWGDINQLTDQRGNIQKVDYNLSNNSKLEYFIAKENLALGNSDNVKENVVETFFDQWGNIIEVDRYPNWPDKSNPISQKFTFDYMGNILSHIDGEGYSTSYQYDKLNRLNAVIDALNQKTEYDYDIFGNLVNVKQTNGQTIWENKKEYNEKNKLSSKLTPSNGKETFNFTPSGNLQSRTDLNLNNHQYSYDNLNRLFTSQSNNLLFKYYYNSLPFGPEKIELQNTETQTVQGFDEYEYDYAGNITSHTSNSLGLQQQTTYQYNHLNQLTQQSVQNDFSIHYQYDNGLLRRIQTDGNSTENFQDDNKSLKYEYFNDGKVKSIVYPRLRDARYLRTEYTYDKLNRLNTLVNYLGDSVKSRFEYTYDKNDNIMSISKDGQAPIQYKYDKLNRMIEITGPERVIKYHYDSRGNRIASINHNLDSSSDTQFKYNALNQLSSVKKDNQIETTYDYNSQGLRSVKTTGNDKVFYNYDLDGRIISESNGTNQIEANYIWGQGRVLVKHEKSVGGQYYYLYNGHGDVIEILDDHGNTVNSYQYDEWGNITNQVEAIINPFKYTGEVFDEESGLYYLRARYYDPTSGRFISKDTYEGNITNPLSLNQYTYVGNNPLKYIDPSGHMRLDQIDSLLNGMKQSGFDAVKDLLNTPGALKELVMGLMAGELTFTDIAKSMAASTIGPFRYLGNNFNGAILNPFASDKEVYDYGKQLGNALQTIIGSFGGAAAIKIISKAAPKLGKILTKAEGCNCFTAGTKVLTDEGEKPIEEIEVGDKVLAKSDETGEVAYKEVVGLFQKQADEIYYVHIGDEIIEVTAEHPFWLNSKGWTFVKDLKVGDLLVSSDGTKLAIDKIEKEPREATVYNFEVREFNSYFVSNLEIWVHNCSVLNWSDYRIEHVKDHGKNNILKEYHGVFYGDPISVTNKAWANKGDIEPIRQGNRDVYHIPYANAGYQGGYRGQGQNLNYITIVVDRRTGDVVTSYPSPGR
jgi:RHS repeat-associated protein